MRALHRLNQLLLVFCLYGLFWPQASMAQSLTILGSLYGESGNSSANGISGDGFTVVGTSYSLGNEDQAFRWSLQGGMVGLGSVAGGNRSEAYAASYDGSVIVGSSSERLPSGIIQNQQAFRWTNSGMVGLGIPNGAVGTQARSVSADGLVVGGSIDYAYDPPNPHTEAMRWTALSGVTGLGFVGPQGFSSFASGTSADGSVMVGTHHQQYQGPPYRAMRWSGSDGMMELGTLPGSTHSLAYGISGDGQVIVGMAASYGLGTDRESAFRWTEEDGMLALFSDPPPDGPSGERFVSWANAASHDGSVIVGRMGYRNQNGGFISDSAQAFIWTQATGARSLESILTGAGVDLDGWLLEWARDVSADGQVVVGDARKAVGSGFITRGFVVDLRAVPEPSTALYLAFAGTLTLCRRRRG